MPYDRYKGILFNKTPDDIAGILEAIRRMKPKYIIECGTQFGGATVAMADVLEENGGLKVITIDIVDQRDLNVKKDARIIFIQGDSKSPEVFDQVKRIIGSEKNVLVDLDSDHHKDHVLQELFLYHVFVPIDGYIVVEDTSNYWDNYERFNGGPLIALIEFIRSHPEFEIDRTLEGKNPVYNKYGYLKKVK